MNLQGQLAISLLLVLLMVWIIRSFAARRLSSTQALFWLVLLGGGEILTLSPGLVDRISLLWGNLVPVSWITFLGLVSLIAYLLYQSTKINELESRLAEMARSLAFLEARQRGQETSSGEEEKA